MNECLCVSSTPREESCLPFVQDQVNTLLWAVEPAEQCTYHTLLPQLGEKPRDCWPGQIPIDKRETAEIQPSLGDIPARHGRRKKKSLDAAETTWPAAPLPKATMDGAELLGCQAQWVPGYPRGSAGEAPFSSAGPPDWEEGDWKRGR